MGFGLLARDVVSCCGRLDYEDSVANSLPDLLIDILRTHRLRTQEAA